jgi:hypothetical protein
MAKAIMYYLRKNVDTAKIRKYLNEIYETDLTTKEVIEAIEFIQKTKKEKNSSQKVYTL